MKKLILLGLVIAGVFMSCGQEKRYSPDGVISLSLIEPHDSFPDLLALMQETNPNMICLFMLGDSAKNEQFPFSISKMVEVNSIPIDQAFNEFVKDVAPPLTKIVSAESYEKNGKRYYRKISETNFDENTTKNLMFYFMKDNRSNILYEIKASTSPEKSDFVLRKLEEMAASVVIK